MAAGVKSNGQLGSVEVVVVVKQCVFSSLRILEENPSTVLEVAEKVVVIAKLDDLWMPVRINCS